MNFRKRGFRAIALGLLVAGGLALAPAAFAGGHFSVGVNLPGVSIGYGGHHGYVGVYGPGYYAPAYYATPVYYDYGPAPVYYDSYYYGPAYYGAYYYGGHGHYRGGYRGHDGYYRGGHDGYRGGHDGGRDHGGYYRH